MKIILKKDVDKLGKADQIIIVKDGFARNFLIPKGLAIPITQGNLKQLEEEKQKRTIQLEKLKKHAEEIKQKLAGLSLTIPVLTQETDKLYGSITAVDLLNALKEDGIEIDKNKLSLDEPITSLGIYEIPVKLHPEVNAVIKVWVVKK